MQSIFRYPGGKTRKHIRDWITSHCPQGVKEYREPFVGGGGIFWSMHHPDKRWINDRHEGLISVYTALRDRPYEFISACREIEPPGDNEEMTEPGPRGKATYPKRMLDVFNEVKLNTECDQAFRYYYINRTVFGGRVNYDIPSRLYFSNPNGWNITRSVALEDAAKHIGETKITCGDFEPLLSEPGEDVWVYCDPPYAVNTDFSPTSQLYQHGFSREDHKRFADAVAKSPHKVCVSYDDDPDGFIRGLFSDSRFRIIEASWTYCGSTNEKKEVGKELLILNYDPPGTIIVPPERVQINQDPDGEEQRLLDECESVIDQGLKWFIHAGNALRIIRDSGKPSRRIYRKTYSTFEDYCKGRWGFSKSRANQLILATEAVEQIEMTTNCCHLPAAEGQARELTRLSAPEQITEVWQAVTEDAESDGKKITASYIRPYVDAALDYQRPEPDHFAKIMKLWNKLDEDEKQRFLSTVSA